MPVATSSVTARTRCGAPRPFSRTRSSLDSFSCQQSSTSTYFTAIGFSSIGSTRVAPLGSGACLRCCSSLGAAFLGFWLGAALCRASRDAAVRRITVAAALIGLAVWPLAWDRLSVVGSHRQFTRDYGLLVPLQAPPSTPGWPCSSSSAPRLRGSSFASTGKPATERLTASAPLARRQHPMCSRKCIAAGRRPELQWHRRTPGWSRTSRPRLLARARFGSARLARTGRGRRRREAPRAVAVRCAALTHRSNFTRRACEYARAASRTSFGRAAESRAAAAESAHSRNSSLVRPEPKSGFTIRAADANSTSSSRGVSFSTAW